MYSVCAVYFASGKNRSLSPAPRLEAPRLVPKTPLLPAWTCACHIQRKKERNAQALWVTLRDALGAILKLQLAPRPVSGFARSPQGTKTCPALSSRTISLHRQASEALRLGRRTASTPQDSDGWRKAALLPGLGLQLCYTFVRLSLVFLNALTSQIEKLSYVRAQTRPHCRPTCSGECGAVQRQQLCKHRRRLGSRDGQIIDRASKSFSSLPSSDNLPSLPS